MDYYFESKPAEIVAQESIKDVDSNVCLVRLENHKLALMTRRQDNQENWEPFYVKAIETGFWDTRNIPNIDFDEVFMKYRELGANTCLFMLHWRDIEPEDGKFTFEYPDRVVKAAKKHGIKIWFVFFTHMHYDTYMESNPDFWVYKQDSSDGEDRAIQWVKDGFENILNSIEKLCEPKPKVEILPSYAHPIVFERIIRVIRQLGKHYRHSESVIGLQIGNEEGFTYYEAGKTWDSGYDPYTLKLFEEWKLKTGKSSWHAFKLWAVKWWWRQFTTAFHEEDPYKLTSFNFGGGWAEIGDPYWIHQEGVDVTTYGEGNLDVIGSMFYSCYAAKIWENLDQHYDYIYSLPILIPSEIGIGRFGKKPLFQQYFVNTLERGAQGFSVYCFGELMDKELISINECGLEFQKLIKMLTDCEDILWSGVPGFGTVKLSTTIKGVKIVNLNSSDGSSIGILHFPEYFNSTNEDAEDETMDVELVMETEKQAEYSVHIYIDGRTIDMKLGCKGCEKISLPNIPVSSLVFIKIKVV